MKVRNGFVSNSSSSSFVIKKCKKFPDTKAIAEYMIDIRNADADKIFYDMQYDVELDNLYYNIKPTDKNLIFRTTNYNTYIINAPGYIVVLTSNNHDNDWESLNKFKCSIDKIPKQIRNKYYKYPLPADACRNISIPKIWYNLEHNIRGTPYWTNAFLRCYQLSNIAKGEQQCYGRLWEENKNITCLYCKKSHNKNILALKIKEFC